MQVRQRVKPRYEPAQCHRCGAKTWCEWRQSGTWQCRACKVELFFSNMLYRPIGMTLIGWQKKALREIYGTVNQETGVRVYTRAFISMGKKNGKQLDLRTPIPTPLGWKTMGSLRVGDLVFSDQGKPTRVVAISEVDSTERAFEVQFTSGTSVVAGARHEWVGQKIGGQPSKTITATTEELFKMCSSLGRSVFRIPITAPVEYTPLAEDLPIDAYTYGLWIGDGCATKPELSVHCDDVELTTQLIPYEVSNKWKNGVGNSMILRVPELSKVLVKTHTDKKIEQQYLQASVQQRWDLLAGLMDSDGCISNRKGQAIYVTVLPKIRDGVLELLRSLGIKATWSEIQSSRYGVPNQLCYRVTFTVFDDLPVSKLPRKLRNRVTRSFNEKSKYEYVREIREVEKRPMRCIQVDCPSHLYLAGDGMVATHNSYVIGGLPLYHLIAEDVDNPEVYGCAAAKDQAGIVYRSTLRIAKPNPAIMARVKLVESKKQINRRGERTGFYSVLSADGDVQDGIEPSLLIRDEIHRWKTQKAKTLKDVTTKGQISRREPLDIVITTAGAEYESPIWWEEYSYAKKVQSGAIEDPGLYVLIYEADAKRDKIEPQYWMSREARVAANPSHEDLGGFLKDAAIVQELNKAIAQPAEKSSYKRYHLNMPLHAEEEPVIEMADWIESGVATGAGVDLREWPEYDYELLIQKWGLLERPCYAGVDASWTTDLTAIVFIFPPWEETVEDGTVVRPGCDSWTLLPFFYMPEGQVEKIARVTKVPFKTWIEKKFVDTTPGKIIDQQAVIERVQWGRGLFDLREVPYDRMNFRTEALRLAAEGVVTTEVPQNFMQLSNPTKWLLGAYTANLIRHGNNPVMNWMASCLQLQYDKKDGCQPSKPERMKSSKRIDGFQATITGLNRALLMPLPTKDTIEVWG